mgnify:FL=1
MKTKIRIEKIYLDYKEKINYVIVGGFTTVVSLASYYLCVLTVLNSSNPVELQAANIISWICAVTFAFFTNRKYVFESVNVNVLNEALKFVGARVTTLIVDMLCMAVFVSFFKLNDKISKILVQIIVFLLNYIFSKAFVFKQKIIKE